MDKKATRNLPRGNREILVQTLESRFQEHSERHGGIAWPDVRQRLLRDGGKLWSLGEMESSGGEPDVIGHDPKTGEYIFVDCAPQAPKGRRSLCYDRAALDARKEHRPKDSAMAVAAAMGIELLSEDEYRGLQALGEFDTTTSSWLLTPADVRKLGGALFGDRRFGRVFIYHNGAESYYAARGFRGSLKV
jgi:hypothetical protein